MHGKLHLLAIPLIALVILAWTLYSQRNHLATYFPVHVVQHSDKGPVSGQARVGVSDGEILPAAAISSFLKAIFYRQSAELQSFQCPYINATRYESLTNSPGPSKPRIRYYLALNLRQNLALLPRLIGSIVEVIRFLGPEYCILSIVEGNSPDGTGDVLSALRPDLEALGATYFFQSSPIDPTKNDRIESLAALRNLALQPLHENRDRITKDTTVIFSNDVTACPDDLLELIYQRKSLGADMTCAMDWNLENPRFYDIWIARDMNGDAFIDVPNGNWRNTSELFWNSAETRARYDAMRPFQVFSCWNGAAVFGAEPLLDGLRFRSPKTDECSQGEPQLFCKEMWYKGYGKIAVVPSVNLEYKLDMGRKIKEKMGFTADVVSTQNPTEDFINWKTEPPANVKCIKEWNDQFWVPWNESLP
ncbi:hypothetical protein FGRMN_3788 [Fusarium graminum]|nr:hypothetical protein FGRMN_3788 [Fusarium graminum]